jgi:hypothetical protein
MKKFRSLLILGGVLMALLFTNCPGVVLPEVDSRPIYAVAIGAVENGQVRLSQWQANEGEWIIVYMYPDPGYRLNPDPDPTLHNRDYRYSYIDTTSGQRVVQTSQIRKVSSYQFPMPAGDVEVTVKFEPAPAGVFAVSVDSNIVHGEILTDPTGYSAGSEVILTVIPESGYGLASGSLMVSGLGPLNDAPPYKFNITAHATVTAQFTQKGADGLRQDGWNALSAGEYDAAMVFYEAAYQQNPSDPETIVYSSLGKLGSLLLSRDVRTLLSSFDFAVIPSTLKDWICDKDWTGVEDDRWYETYAGIYFDPADGTPYVYYEEDAALPKLATNMQGFPGGFLNFQIVHKFGYLSPPSRIIWPNLLFWALITNNRDGFNNRLDDILKYAFGSEFEEAASRVEKLSYDSPPVLLNDRLKERFDLDEFYGSEPTYIGRAEMEMIFAGLRAIKAGVEFLSSYDWEIQLRTWLLNEIEPGWGLEGILERMFNMAINREESKPFWRESIDVARILPLKNNFLKIRNRSAMVRARKDFTDAVNAAQSAVEHYFGSGNRLSDTAKTNLNTKYLWARGAVNQAKTAIEGGGGGIFYFPKKLPKNDAEKIAAVAWPDGTGEVYLGNPENRVYGINIETFFTPGTFTLPNLITTTAAGTIPVMYRLKWHEDANHNIIFDEGGAPVTAENTVFGTMAVESIVGFDTPRNDLESSPPVVRPADWELGPYGIFSFEINTANLKRVFPKGFQQHGDTAFLHDVFPTIPIWPWAKTYLDGMSPAARQLYQYYNMR